MLKIILIVILITLIEATSMSCLKEYQRNNKYLYLVSAMFLYSLVCLLLVNIYSIGKIGLINVLWSGLSVVVVLIFGIVFFKETIHFHDVVAIILIVTGISIVKVTE